MYQLSKSRFLGALSGVEANRPEALPDSERISLAEQTSASAVCPACGSQNRKSATSVGVLMQSHISELRSFRCSSGWQTKSRMRCDDSYILRTLKRTNWVTHWVTTSPNLPIYGYENVWETVETICLWFLTQNQKDQFDSRSSPARRMSRNLIAALVDISASARVEQLESQQLHARPENVRLLHDCPVGLDGDAHLRLRAPFVGTSSKRVPSGRPGGCSRISLEQLCGRPAACSPGDGAHCRSSGVDRGPVARSDVFPLRVASAG
jgi:hypothetical protein